MNVGRYLRGEDRHVGTCRTVPREGSNPKGECPPGPSAEHEEPGRNDAPNPDEDRATMAAPTPQEPT